MKNKISILAGIALFFFIAQSSFAQVTIGCYDQPLEGSLLQLSEGETTTKGMMLPRVGLTSINTLQDIAPDEADRPNPLDHAGLMVYNVNTEEYCYTIRSGVYVWSGQKWISAMRNRRGPDFIKDASKSGKVEVYTDHEGNKFLAAQMGSAGTWMLTNQSVKQYSNGVSLASYNATAPAQTKAYANHTGSSAKDPIFGRQFGLLYNWDAATGQGVAGLPPNQGICSPGWHIPTKAEWLKLLKEVYANSPQYGAIAQGSTSAWQAGWDQSDDYVGDNIAPTVTSPNNTIVSPAGVGSILKNMCITLDGNNPLGLSNPYSNKGFNAFMGGFMSGGHYLNDGVMAYFWTSELEEFSEDNIENNKSSVAYLSGYEAGSGRSAMNRSDFVSVRCVKN